MQRIVEPELMDDDEQARAYAEADFSESNSLFVKLLRQHHGNQLTGNGLDLGCGPGDICFLLADNFPELNITGVDGSPAMLRLAEQALAEQTGQLRLQFQQLLLPSGQLPTGYFDVILSNSLLHHLHDPQVLWRTIRDCGRPGSSVQVMDLFRPDSAQQAAQIVTAYAEDEAEILKTDFYNSLLAAFTPAEVSQQLATAGLDYLSIETISDRHMMIHGQLA